MSSNYDDCTHGDMSDYMCMDCTFKRWESEWDIVKPPRSSLSLPRFHGQGLTLTKVTVKNPEPSKNPEPMKNPESSKNPGPAQNNPESAKSPGPDRSNSESSKNPGPGQKNPGPAQVNPSEIMQSVNWEKVFRFAGVQMQKN